MNADERVPLDMRIGRRIARLDCRKGQAWFRLRNESWREDLADAIAIAAMAVVGDGLVFMVSDSERRLMLEESLMMPSLQATIEVS